MYEVMSLYDIYGSDNYYLFTGFSLSVGTDVELNS